MTVILLSKARPVSQQQLPPLPTNPNSITSLTHDIIIPLFLTDDHPFFIASHVVSGPALVQRLRPGPKQTGAVLLTEEKEVNEGVSL